MSTSELKVDVGNSHILTGKDGEFSISDELREILCYMDDGRLLISKSHQFNAHVRGFIGRLERMGRPCEKMYVDLSVIARAYAGVAADSQYHSASEMQRAVMALLDKAVEERASDIHLRISKRDKTRIFLRVHNDLEFVEEHPYDYGNQLCSTIYQAMADVSDSSFEPLSRQDARIGDPSKLPPKLDGIRIATSPQVDGYIMILRLLYNDTSDTVDLCALGYNELQRDSIVFMKKRPTGVNIIGGPTGSGKSTTLQRILTSVIKEAEGRKHVITVEDPPEYPIPGSVQTPVTNADSEEERSRAFQQAIKAAMRLDPDVIMIGEIRDTPSAKLAIQAAMTGHQVWSTVHANSAFSILDRLLDLGVPLELLSDPSIITGLACQRLLKVLCPSCKKHLLDVKERYADSDLRRVMGVVRSIDKTYVRGDGCAHCRNSGSIGRTVVAEVVITDQHLMSFIRKHDRISAVEYWKRDQSGITMLDHAIEKINEGLVDPFQAEDVIGPLTMGIIERDYRIEANEVRNVVS
jgi:type II secretory ATPase GspE/PulE/Tfp pilus assembly ATPase PilB-like protein